MQPRLNIVNVDAFIEHEIKLMGTGWTREKYLAHIATSANVDKRTAESIALAFVPRHFTVGTSRQYAVDEPASFLTVGCHGEGTTEQFRVARLLNEATQQPKPPLFTLLLGDNIYADGASEANDSAFDSVFHKIYLGPSPIQMLGNHDENNHTQRKKIKRDLPEYGIARGMHQILHTYTNPAGKEKPNTVDETLQQARKIDTGRIVLDDPTKPGWFMPARFASYTFKDFPGNPDNNQETTLICMDSNTYVHEYVEYLEKGDDVSVYNQARWIEECIQSARTANPPRKVILALHHPAKTQGERSYKSDYQYYLHTKEDIELAKKHLKNCFEVRKPSYNALMLEVLTRQFNKLRMPLADTMLTAHDHSNSLFNNLHTRQPGAMPILQITAGGGGGKLQHRGWYGDQRELAYFADRNGLVKVSCDADPTLLNYDLRCIESVMRTNDGTPEQFSMSHQRFNNKSNTPLHHYADMSQSEIEALTKFKLVVKEAIQEYIDFIHREQEREHGHYFVANPKHGYDGVKRVHAVWNYLNQYEARSFYQTLADVSSLTSVEASFTFFTKPTKDSFLTLLEKQIDRHYRGATLKQLMDLHKPSAAPAPSTLRPRN